MAQADARLRELVRVGCGGVAAAFASAAAA
jgi:hypothetical protein